MPTWLLKQYIELLALFLCQLFNWTLEHGIFSSMFTCAYIMPILKKADLDAADVRSHQPIFNLSVLSQLLERLLSRQLLQYLKDSGLLSDFQSAYPAHHSMETPLLNVLSNILLALDLGNLAMYVCTSRPIGSIRQCRSRYAPAAAKDSVQSQRSSNKLFWIVPERSSATDPINHV